MDESLAITWRRIPERYRLEGSYCKTCKTAYFPIRKLCTKCRRKGDIVTKRFSGKGKVFSFTKIFSPPRGFELQAPYWLGIVELEEGPHVTSQIIAQGQEIKIGDAVRMVFRKIQEDGEEGLIHYGFKFKVVQ